MTRVMTRNPWSDWSHPGPASDPHLDAEDPDDPVTEWDDCTCPHCRAALIARFCATPPRTDGGAA